MKIETIEIAGLSGALTALRLPFGKEVRSTITGKTDSYIAKDNLTGEKTHLIVWNGSVNIDNKDLALMQKLIKGGDCEAKAIRGIMVWAKITAPIYWWCEEETYRAGHERLCSESTMHIDCKGLKGEELQKAKAAIPMGKELTKVDMFSYQALRNMYIWRSHHRLPEWHQFCDWIASLPLANELILVDL